MTKNKSIQEAHSSVLFCRRATGIGVWSLVGHWTLVIGHWPLVLGPLLAFLLLIGCSSRSVTTPEQRYNAAKALFDQTTKQYHLPSAEAKGAEREKLLKQAAAGYEQVMKKYPDQEYWAVQALRNLAGIRASQGKLTAAVKLYASVEKKFPKQDWEILQAWKSAADLLWENGQKDQARIYYSEIVTRFDLPEAPQVVKTVVRGSKRRLAGEGAVEPAKKAIY